MNTNEQEIVYHYCGVEAFFNIIKNSTIWLSDVLKSNDSQECIWLRDLVKSKIEAYLSENSHDALHAWQTGYQMNESIEDNMTIYATCFSESSDTLSQWRGYAQDGSGLAIGFSKKHLQAINYPYSPMFEKVVYQNQERFVNRIVKENIKNMQKKGIGHVALELNQNYRIEFARYKNPSFKEEKEWRIILRSRPGSPKINCSFGGIEFLETQFRCADRKIISYLEMDFSQIKQDIIKEIWIGPKSKITPIDVRNMLSVYGYYGDTPYNTEKPIPIICSKSSYR